MNNKKFLKKVLLLIVLVCTTFIATACNFTYPPNGDNSSSGQITPSNPDKPTPPKTEPKDSFPAIPVHKQSKVISDQEILGSDFFSSKNDYFNISSKTRYVNLTKEKTVYIRYEQDLDSEVKHELDVIIEYLQNFFKFDSSYKIILDKGTPSFLDVLTYDTIYIRTPDKKVLNEFNNQNAAALTYRSNMSSPVIYMNKSVFNTFINGKNILLARALLHEIMHGFGFGHTEGMADLMAAFHRTIHKDSNNNYYYFEPGTKNRIYVNDYYFFSNDEISAIIQYLVPNKSYAEKVSLYKTLGGVIPNLNIKFEDMKSNFLINTRTYSVSNKSPDILLENQIVSMKDKTNNFEIIINNKSTGIYTCVLSDGTSFTGKSKIMNVSGSRLTNQIIALTDFIYEGKTIDITLYAVRSQSGKFYQRWKVYSDNINLVFADNTANYFGGN